jgi:hypothetical protein
MWITYVDVEKVVEVGVDSQTMTVKPLQTPLLVSVDYRMKYQLVPYPHIHVNNVSDASTVQARVR